MRRRSRRNRSDTTGAGLRNLVVVLSLVWIGALTTGQAVAGGRLVVVSWVALAPFATSLVTGCRLTAVTAGSAVASVALLSSLTGGATVSEGLIRVAGSAALALVAVLSAHVRLRREQRIREVTEVATVAQAAILSPIPPRLGDLRLASRYRSASAQALVGGDLFDVVVTENAATSRVRLLIGDVRGKGLPAVQVAATVLAAFRQHGPRSDLTLQQLALRVERSVTPGLSAEDFVTAAFCEVDQDGRFGLVLCGHPAPLLLGQDEPPVAAGTQPGPPLGLGVEPVLETGVLEPGQRMLFYTDGLAEARARGGEFFDVESAVSDLGGEERCPPGLNAALATLMDRVDRHAGRTDDDLALMILQWR